MMIVLTFPILALAHNALAGNLTAPDEKVGWVSTTPGRGTSEILWSCASIFLVCSWKCVHLNIPRLKESTAGWHWWPTLKGRWKWISIPYRPESPLLWKWFRKIVWMGVIIISPEVGVYVAMTQRREAKDVTMTMMDDGWTSTHSHYTVMGGLFGCLQADVEKPQNSLNKETSLKPPNDEESQKLPDEENLQTPPNKEKPLRMGLTEDIPEKLWVINSKTLRDLKRNYPDLKFPTITKASIQDRSKADAFTKAFALVQSGWLVVQSIARVSVGLQISQLELATMAFVFCALIMYILWWDKPFDIEHKTVVTFPTLDPLENRNDFPLPQPTPLKFDQFRDYRQSDLTSDSFSEMFIGILELGRHTMFGKLDYISSLTFYTTGTVFSAIHLAAWNWEFPSLIDCTLWRVFGALSTTIPVFFIATNLILGQIAASRHYDHDHANALIVYALIVFLALVYCISRLGLIVLIFRCFSSMPAGVYETVEWTKYLPHFQ